MTILRPDTQDMWWPEEEQPARLLRQPGLVVPVTGAGLSHLDNMPLASEVGEWLSQKAEKLGVDIPDNQRWNFQFVGAQLVADSDDPEKSLSELRDEVAEYFHLDTHGARPGVAARSLVHVPSKLIITFNYDHILEEAALLEGVPFESITWKKLDNAFERFGPGSHYGDPLLIVHIHGDIDVPESMIFNPAYSELLDSNAVGRFWDFVATSRRLLFMGTGLDEPYLETALQKLKGGSRQHVIVVSRRTSEEIKTGRGSLSWAQHGLYESVLPNLPSGEPHFTKLNGLAWKLTVPARSAVHGGPFITADHELPECYTANSLIEPDPDRSDAVTSLIAEWDFSGDRFYSGLFSEGERNYAEDDVAKHDRTLVIGDPGSGKTELLRKAGRGVPGDYIPVLIRLADVRHQPGNPEVILRSWAEQGVGLLGEASVSAGALEGQIFHFFLDGLDEVPLEDQVDVVRRVREIAAACPQHRLTVSSRPTESLEGFPTDEWRVLQIVPTARWQDEFLDCRGLSWDEDIAPSFHGVNDARELLRLPFFLSRVVELEEKGRLSEVKDLWSLLDVLVVDALSKEIGELTVEETDARAWLQDVALAMLLTGRVSLTSEEVEQVPLPAPVSSSTAEVCDMLVSRLMLRPSATGGTVAFTHRLFAAFLAAEALDRHGPADELLAALAPVESDVIRGVRPDALVPVGLVLSHNEIWREAVRDRDAIAVARATALDAATEERRTAARLLWDQYAEWGVWIWDYNRPDIVEDAKTLGALLRSPDLDDLAGEIQSLITSNEMHLQGNAIRSLGYAGRTAIEPDLEAVLKDDSVEAVVRRQAAIAANDLGLIDLLPLIIDRAHSSDSSEEQDCSLMAMRLAPEDRVLETALALADAGSSAQHTAISYTLHRLGPEEALKVLARVASESTDHYSSFSNDLLKAVGALEDPSDEAVKNALFAAVVWREDGHEIQSLITGYRDAALEGLAAAAKAGSADWFDLMRFAHGFTADELEGAGLADDVVSAQRRREELLAGEAAGAGAVVTRPDQPDEEPEQEPTLAELLDAIADPTLSDELEKNVWLVQRNAHHFAAQVKDLDAERANRLSDLLDEWWPEKPFAETITRKADSGWSQENPAAAWTWFGPPLNKSVSPQQWAELAVSGLMHFEEQSAWLRSQFSPEALPVVAEIVEGDDGELWLAILRAIPEEADLPDELVAKLVTQLKRGDDYRISAIGRRLAESVGLGPVQELAQVSDLFRQNLLPILAQNGDRVALDELLDDLEAKLKAGQVPDSDELGWLAGIGTDISKLDQLFLCLQLAYTRPSPGGFADPVTPLISTINELATADAEKVVAGYDQLFDQDSRCRWLRPQREGIVQGRLGELGQEASDAAASAVRLPHVPAEE